MRKRRYEIWNPKTNETKTITTKEANKYFFGDSRFHAAHLKMGKHFWSHTGKRIKCVQ